MGPSPLDGLGPFFARPEPDCGYRGQAAGRGRPPVRRPDTASGDNVRGNLVFDEGDAVVSARRTWNKAVAATIAERSKDGAFVFHDPKLDPDLNLVKEQRKSVRGMEGYGWFANVIFHDKDEPRSNTPSISGTSPKVKAQPNGHPRAERAEAGR